MSFLPQIPSVGVPAFQVQSPPPSVVGIPQAVTASDDKDAVFANVTEFKAHLKEICNALDSLWSMNNKLHELKAGEAPAVDKGQLRAMFTDVKVQIKDLYKHYGSKSKKGKKKEESTDGTPKVPRRSGFDTPTFVSQHMINFFTANAAHLGLDPKTKQSLANLLNCLKTKGLTTSTILTDLWAIYAIFINNGLNVKTEEKDAKGKPKITSHYRADENMKHCFGPSGSNTFAHLQSLPAKTGRNGKVIPGFTPDHFQYITFQSIFSHNRLLPAEKPGAFHLTQAQADLLQAMNKWLELTKVPPEQLPESSRRIYQAVVSNQMLPGASAEEVKLVQQCSVARRELAELEAEQRIVTEAHAALKAAVLAAAPPKKTGTRTKRAPVAASAAPVTNGVAYSVVPGATAVPRF
jgi:hypothetical protein